MVLRVLRWLVGILVVTAVLGGGYLGYQVWAFDRSMDKVRDIPLPAIAASTDPAVIARGKHLAEGIAACATVDCHGADLGGGRRMQFKPVADLTGPNLTLLALAYSDGELARLVRHGVKRDGRSVRFMAAQDICWLPDDELRAVISYIRTVPTVTRENGGMSYGVLAKLLDRHGMIVFDVARRIEEQPRPQAVPAGPTVEYGKLIARLCSGCHGDKHLAGGPIPGAPPNLPAPANLTPHPTGLQGLTWEQWNRLIDTGTRHDGRPLDPMMPFEVLQHLDPTERRALYLYLMSLPPVPMGER